MKGYPCLYLFTLPVELNSVSFVIVRCLFVVVCCCLSFVVVVCRLLLFVVFCYLLFVVFCHLLFFVGFYLSLFGVCRCFLFVGSPGGLGGPGSPGGPGRQCGPGLSGWSRWSGGSNLILRPGGRVVLVIKFVNAYGLHGVNNQIIENT